jgi:hypothetical protein
VIAATDLIATLPSRIVKGLPEVPNIRVLAPPFPDVEARTCSGTAAPDPIRCRCGCAA